MAKNTNDRVVVELGGRSIRNPKNRYTKAPNWILRDNPDLHLREKCLLFFLLSYSEGMIPRISDMERHHADGIDAISNSLARLEEAGYIRRVRMVDERGLFVQYKYYFPKNTATSKKKERKRRLAIEPSPEVHAGKPVMENPRSENHPLQQEALKVGLNGVEHPSPKIHPSKSPSLLSKITNERPVGESLRDSPTSKTNELKNQIEGKTDKAANPALSVTPFPLFEFPNSEKPIHFFFDAETELAGVDLWNQEIAEAERLMAIEIRPLVQQFCDAEV